MGSLGRRRRHRLAPPALAVAGLLVGIAGAGGCTTVQSFEPAPLVYADRTPIRFSVDRVEVVDQTAAGGRTAFEQRLDVPPAVAAKALLQSRLAAVGGTGLVRASITQAAIERRELPTRTGITGLFTREPEAALTGRLEVRVAVLAPDGEQVASVSSGTTLRRTVPEGASLAEQRKIAFDLVRDLVDELDTALEANIGRNLNRYLVSSPGLL